MTTPSSSPPKKTWSWRSQAFRALVYQVVAVAVIVLTVLYLANNTATNMRARGIQSGFDFLNSAAGFDIGESIFPFDSGENYWQAYFIGMTNTLRVAVLGIVMTTVLGTLIGVGRFSRNALIRGLCISYVEFFRNIPVLLQLLMWYLLFTEMLPPATEPWVLGPMFLSKGGLNFPIPVWATGQLVASWGLLLGLPVAWWYRRYA
ncbi:MAG: ABC transporter permease subunit, partial [Rhodoferax sp.]|nr:ABC transporter permease subunit [Rhodoferax sp.]